MMNKVREQESHDNNPSSNLINKSKNEFETQDIAFIPYNNKWGVNQMLGIVNAVINSDKKYIVDINATTSYLGHAIANCISDEELKNKNARYITFDVEYSEQYKCSIINRDSFQIYYGTIRELGELQKIGVFLEITNFISPTGQVWASESHYEEYADGISAIYECSDGTLVNSYREFKIWEQELTLRPNNPNYGVLQSKTSLSDIRHYEVQSDGTVWRDETLMHEYLKWRNDHNHNYQDGYYCGTYGIANSFKEYAKIHNACYFVMNGMKQDEQHMDPTYNLLFSSKKAADEYGKRLKSFQKKI